MWLRSLGEPMPTPLRTRERLLRAIREDLGLKSDGLLPGDLIRLHMREEDTDEDRELWKQLISGS